jgi:uncharacterized repeat protein (TIGR01451 family)
VNTPIVYEPEIELVKATTSGDRTDEDGDGRDSAGDTQLYTYTVTNTGNVTLFNAAVTDDNGTPGDTSDDFTVALTSGLTDEDGDGMADDLAVGAMASGTATYVFTQDDIDAGSYANIGTVTADDPNGDEVTDDDDETVTLEQEPEIDVEKSVKTNLNDFVLEDGDDTAPGLEAATSTDVQFRVVVKNDGNATLSNIKLTDSVVQTLNGVPQAAQTIVFTPDMNAATLDAYNVFIDLDGSGDRNFDGSEDWVNFDTNADGVIDAGAYAQLSPGESFTLYYSLTSQVGQHDNTAVISGTIGAETVTDNDHSNYFVLPSEDCVGVGTPGFWGNNGFAFWNGVSVADGDAAEAKHAGKPGFAESDLLIQGNTNGTVDSNGDGMVTAADKGLLIGDYNQNGVTDVGEDTIFIAYADAVSLINASNRQTNGGQADGIYMVGRDVVATWLNFLANNPNGSEDCIGQVDNDGRIDPREAIDAAVDWLQQFASNKNADDTIGPKGTPAGDDTNTNTNFHSATTKATFEFDGKIETKSASWNSTNTVDPDLALSGSQIHNALDQYNNTGFIGDETDPNNMYCCDRDDASALDAMAQVDAWLSQQASGLGSTDLSLQDVSQMMYANTLVSV